MMVGQLLGRQNPVNSVSSPPVEQVGAKQAGIHRLSPPVPSLAAVSSSRLRLRLTRTLTLPLRGSWDLGAGEESSVVVAAAAAAACSSSAFVSDAHFSSGFPFSNGGWRLGFPPSLPIQGDLIDLRGRGMMFGDMAFEGQGLTTTTASYNHHHHMLSFMGSSPDPTLVPRATTGDVLPPPPSPSPLPKYKFVTASPADWSAQELATLNEGLLRYAHEPSITKYIKIAAMLPAKTIRDVAIRCCWIPGKESRRRKPNDYCSGNLKNKMAASTSVANIPRPPPNNVNLFSLSLHHPSQNRLVPMEVPVLDSATQNLLEENNQLLRQIASNIETFKAEKNMDLILHTNSNIRAISERMRETHGIMGQMPSLPVHVNKEHLSSLVHLHRGASLT